jgi:hypothetical protein
VRIKSTLAITITIGLLAGSSLGVAAQDEADPMAPSTFTWELSDGEFGTDPETGLFVVVGRSEATDPRATGTWTQFEEGAAVEDDGRRYQVASGSIRLLNEGGAWVGTSRGLGTRLLPEGDDSVLTFKELSGEGGYEGLSMFIFHPSMDPEGRPVGFIVPSDVVLPFPEPPAAE